LKYPCILVDPPWAFRTFSKKNTTPHRGEHEHYATLPLRDLVSVPVGAVAAVNSALFMWVVDSHFPEALELGRAWGFEFKTCAFVWDKDGIGMGYWTRKQTEQCWLFTRGKPTRLSKGVRQIIRAPRREHSRKPDEQYAAIEALVAGPRVEFFARTRRPGWDAWGNEVEKYAAEDLLS
jgi:N6-adenosine-specific RNA methylase IME4